MKHVKFIYNLKIYEHCRLLYSFNNIIFQSILFIFTLIIYMKIIKKLLNKPFTINLSVLLILGLFTANYRTVAMLRGETFILFLNSFLLYRIIIYFKNSFQYKKEDIFFCGITIGLLALSRQWAFCYFQHIFFLPYLLISVLKKNYILNFFAIFFQLVF